MFRFRLRTLLIVLALGPPVLSSYVWAYHSFRRITVGNLGMENHIYGSHFEAAIFRPAAKVEQLWVGHPVGTGTMAQEP